MKLAARFGRFDRMRLHTLFHVNECLVLLRMGKLRAARFQLTCWKQQNRGDYCPQPASARAENHERRAAAGTQYSRVLRPKRGTPVVSADLNSSQHNDLQRPRPTGPWQNPMNPERHAHLHQTALKPYRRIVRLTFVQFV